LFFSEKLEQDISMSQRGLRDKYADIPQHFGNNVEEHNATDGFLIRLFHFRDSIYCLNSCIWASF